MKRYQGAKELLSATVEAKDGIRARVVAMTFTPWDIREIVIREGLFFWKRERAIPVQHFRFEGDRHFHLLLKRSEIDAFPIVFRSRMPVESWNEVVVGAHEESVPLSDARKYWVSRLFDEPFVSKSRKLGEVEDLIVECEQFQIEDVLVRLENKVRKLIPIRIMRYDGFQLYSPFPYWVVEKAPSLNEYPDYGALHERTSRYLQRCSEIG